MRKLIESILLGEQDDIGFPICGEWPLPIVMEFGMASRQATFGNSLTAAVSGSDQESIASYRNATAQVRAIVEELNPTRLSTQQRELERLLGGLQGLARPLGAAGIPDPTAVELGIRQLQALLGNALPILEHIEAALGADSDPAATFGTATLSVSVQGDTQPHPDPNS